ncbi:MAG: single-stranded-DNA-specific exonuclease RecJ, partial [Atopostipes suicloacalis]|nr:single-stranded-DNA-specific exonuclease RecJ [Atopostipes suicloacalis]
MTTHWNKTWEQALSVDNNQIEKIAKELNRSSLFVEICLQRGLKTTNEIKEFLTIDENDFHDPFLINDMDKGIERIVDAIETNEKITIYGDYDADGISSTALLYETLDSIGANIDYYLPNRFIEGYGPDITAFDKIIDEGTNLIITVDNGVTGHEAIRFAQEKKVDVIITDHHALPENLPEAYAVIHPAHPNGNYPFPDLAGVGVAFKLATALLGELPVELLDLAAIGTVSDLVSLKGENRAIVHFGLQKMQTTQRLGLQELFQVISIEAQEVDEDTIGFQIGPRLNAIGRLGDANPGVELLTSHNLPRVKELAEFTDNKNLERKSIVEEMTNQAFEKLEKKDAKNDPSEIILLADENWHEGVLGIVASRIVEKTQKATMLFTINSETSVAKGSARSVEGVNLFQALSTIEDLLISFGGHEMAAGMSAEIGQLASIEEKLSSYVKTIKPDDKIQLVDAFVDLKNLSIETIKELESLRPYGTDNTKPLIASSDVSVVQNRTVGLEGNHLKLRVVQDEESLDIISFRNGELSNYLFN